MSSTSESRARIAASEAKESAAVAKNYANQSEQSKSFSDEAKLYSIAAGTAVEVASRYTQAALESAIQSKSYADEAKKSEQISQSGSGAYASVEKAQEAVNSGAETRQFFDVRSSGNYWVERFQNINGTVTSTGDKLINAAFVEGMNHILGRIDESMPATNLTGYQFMISDETGKLGLFAVNDAGGVELTDIDGELQDYLSNLVSSAFSNRINGYQLVFFAADLSQSILAIDNDGGLWIPGVDKPVQDYLVGTSLKIKLIEGVPCVVNSEGKKVLHRYPVASINDLGTGGHIVTYVDDFGITKSGRITEHINTENNVAYNNPLYQYPVSLSVKRAIYFDHNGQSLALGGGGDIKALTTLDESIADICVIFSGQGAGVNGGGASSPTTDSGLGGFTAARARLWQEAPLDSTMRMTAYKLKGFSRNAALMPLIVGRVNARGGTAMAGIKKGTAVYADGNTSMQAFIKRCTQLGILGAIDVVELIHGGDDSHLVNDFGEYLAALIQYKADKLADIKTFSTQTAPPLFSISQLGSRVREMHPSKGMAYGDRIAQDQFDLMLSDPGVIMPCPQWPLNRHTPYRLDFTHLLSPGYALLGEYLAQARAYTREGIDNPNPGRRWLPVMPLEWSFNGNVLTHRWHSPFGGPLRINNSLGIAPGGGASLLKGSALPIKFEQIADTTFATTFDKPPATDDFIQFGFNSTDSFSVNDGAGGWLPNWKYPLVNISDSSTKMSHVMPETALINWAILAGKLPLSGSY